MAERAVPPARPGEVWQADITYVATREGWLYVAVVLDACSRRVVGWAADNTMPTALVARAFERAVRDYRPTGGLLHHWIVAASTPAMLTARCCTATARRRA